MESVAVGTETLKLSSPYMEGEAVRALQTGLRGIGYEFGPIDGTFGPLTAAAVELFKREAGIRPVDSVADRLVIEALGVSTEDLLGQLQYNNPLQQTMETAWCRGKKYLAIGSNIPLPIDIDRTKTAEEYMVAYRVSEHGEPELVPNQLNIYDSVPGDENYSPIWHLHYVIVPDDYAPNTLRSAEDVTRSSYEVRSSSRYVN